MEFHDLINQKTKFSPWTYRRIRRIVSHSKNDITYGISIPKGISSDFTGIKFSIQTSGQAIFLLASGCIL